MVSSPPSPWLERQGRSVCIYTLGRFAIEIDGTPLAAGSGRRQKPIELLKVQLALGGESAPVTQITESLWPDSDGDQAYGAFGIALNRLRKLIGGAALRLRDARLSLDPATCWVDALAFTALMAQVDLALAEGSAGAASSLAEQALALYRGPFLEGDFDLPEILSARERLHGMFLRLIGQVGPVLCAGGAFQQALLLYRRGLEVDDLSEELYQLLMRCYREQGRLAEAAAVYQRCRHILQASLGLEPSPETEALYAALQEDQRRRASTAPTTGEARPAPAAVPEPQGPATVPVPDEHRNADARERRRVTVACYRLRLPHGDAEPDPEQVEALTSGFRSLVETVVQRYDGVVNQFVRDHAIVLFGLPVAHEDDPLRAAAGALALAERLGELPATAEASLVETAALQAGIDVGLVVAERGDEVAGRYTVTGEVVDRAVRMATAETAGPVVVGPEVLRLVAPYFRTEPVSGDGPLAGCGRVTDRRPVQSRFEVARRQGLTLFVGRERELDVLRGCLAQAQAGRGQFVTVAAEAGLGKSRLLYEFGRTLNRSDWIVLTGGCHALGRNTPYLPFLQALRQGLRLREDDDEARIAEKTVRNVLAVDPSLERYLPLYLYLFSVHDERYPLPRHLQGEELRAGLTEAVGALLTQRLRQRPVALLVEDWHWADEASDQTLKALMGMVAEFPLLLALSYRPEYPANWGHMAHHTHLSLKPLDTGQSEVAMRSLFDAAVLPEGLAERVHQRTEGNPFFLEEVCRALQEEGTVRVADGRAVLAGGLERLAIPATVQAVLRSRIDRLDPEALEILRLAAVIGVDFPGAVLERISPQPDRLRGLLERLKEAELVRQTQVFPEAVYRFNHAITQVVAYESLLLQRRRELHGRVGEAIEALYPNRLEAYHEALAHHYGQSADLEKGVRYSEAAGNKAARYFSLLEARRHYREAIELLGRLPVTPERQRQRIDLALKWGSVSFYSPSHELLEALEAARQSATELEDDLRLARIGFWIAMMHYAMGRHADALRQLEQCQETGAVVNDAELNALTANYLGRVYFYLGEFAKAKTYLFDGIPLLERTGRYLEAANSMAILSIVHGYSGEFAEGLGLTERVLAIARESENPAIAAIGNVCRGIVFGMRGDWVEARDAATKARKLSHPIGNPIMEGMGAWGRGCSLVMLGAPAEGLPLMQEGIALIESTESHLGVSAFGGLLAIFMAVEGRTEEAQRLAEKTLHLKEAGGEQLGEHYAYCAQALLAAQAESVDWRKAESLMLKSLRLARAKGAVADLSVFHYRFAFLLASRRRAEQARAHLEQATSLFNELGMTWWLQQAQALAGEVAAV